MAKILIVDGYFLVREFLAEELAAEGNVVVAIRNPDLIDELLSSLHPDLVIMDLYIDGKMQWDLLTRVKSKKPTLPVLIFSAYPSDGDFRLSLAEDYVMKSSGFSRVKKTISRILQKSNPTRPAVPRVRIEPAHPVMAAQPPRDH